MLRVSQLVHEVFYLTPNVGSARSGDDRDLRLGSPAGSGSWGAQGKRVFLLRSGMHGPGSTFLIFSLWEEEKGDIHFFSFVSLERLDLY